MTIKERNDKLKHLITCMKCEVSGKCCDENCPTQYDAGNMGEIIENLEEISKILEQEPFMNKPCVSAGVCEHDKLQLLDRIKADIEKQQYGFMNSTDYANGVRFGLMLAYKIIKKYKKEIEG